MNINQAIIYGRLTKAPELKQAGSHTVCNLSIATNRKYTDQQGNKKEETEYHNAVAWGKQAETIAQYTAKGHTIYIEGRVKTDEWQDKEGNKRYTTRIIVEKFQFGDGNPKKEEKPKEDEIERIKNSTQEDIL